MKPKVFIGSSKESRLVANAIQDNLESADAAEVTVWNQDIFEASKYPLESLLDAAAGADYGIFVFSPEDKLELRGEEVLVARDNVIFELGLFMGRLGRERIFIVKPKNVDLHIPSDLLGLTTELYATDRSDGRLASALATACSRIQRHITSRRSCGYLVRYMEQKEPSFLGAECHAQVDEKWAYGLLLHMFRLERVDQFRAFDLAFNRWQELLDPVDFQTFNISHEIFEAVGRMFEEGRCRTFRRILVVSNNQLRKRSAIGVLRKFQEQEDQWRARYGKIIVETRVHIYLGSLSPETSARIRRLHDFALFAGDDGKLAIVETTLTAPEDQVKTPEFQITTMDRTVKEREIGFEEFWGSSQPIAAVLARISGVDNEDNTDRLASKAFEALWKAYPGMDGNCALVIEAGYFDLRTPDDEDRFRHVDDAFELLKAVQESCKSLHGSIFLDAFINDLGNRPMCHFEACPTDSVTDRRQFVSERVRSQSKYYGVGQEDFELFRMKDTAGSVRKVIRKALRSGSGRVYEQDIKDTTVEIFIDTHSEQIPLGYRDANWSTLTPRCTALMAQHYYDLYTFALKRKPSLKELWIFDFNRYTERESVRKGAEASFVLHSWPEGFTLNIVNCIYSADGKTGTIQVVTGP